LQFSHSQVTVTASGTLNHRKERNLEIYPYVIPYRTKVTKFFEGDENFVRWKIICPRKLASL